MIGYVDIIVVYVDFLYLLYNCYYPEKHEGLVFLLENQLDFLKMIGLNIVVLLWCDRSSLKKIEFFLIHFLF